MFALSFGTLIVYFYEGCKSVLKGWDQGRDEVIWPKLCQRQNYNKCQEKFQIKFK